MTQLQGFGALLFGAVTLAFVGAVAILFGDPASITAALVAMAAAYASQWCAFMATYLDEVDGQRIDGLHAAALLLQLVSILAALCSFIASVWF